MSPKLGRNERCWCGSGLKYKKCHLGREEQEPTKLWDASKELRKAFGRKMCMAPASWKNECEGPIVRAHTVPRSSSLTKIARDGHVYRFAISAEHTAKCGGAPGLVGINSASTFPGFCSYHDNTIFRPLEMQAFGPTQEQYFLLGYRAMLRDFYGKQAEARLELPNRQLDRGKPIEDQVQIQEELSIYMRGVKLGLRRGDIYKREFDRILVNRTFGYVHHYAIRLKSPPEVMCSAAVYPECDFHGNVLQTKQTIVDPNAVPDLITFSSFGTETGGAVVFAWLASRGTACEGFIESLKRLGHGQMPNALIRFFFEFSDNVCLQPSWWESLDSAVQSALIRRMNPFVGCGPDRLMDDGLRLVNWNIVNAG